MTTKQVISPHTEGTRTIKRFLYVNRKAPYGTVYALESLEVILVAAAFDQDVSVVFMDDGVFQLKKNQNTSDIGIKNFSNAYRALADYEVDKIYVDHNSMLARGLNTDDLIIPVQLVSTDQLQNIMQQQDVVISS